MFVRYEKEERGRTGGVCWPACWRLTCSVPRWVSSMPYDSSVKYDVKWLLISRQYRKLKEDIGTAAT